MSSFSIECFLGVAKNSMQHATLLSKHPVKRVSSHVEGFLLRPHMLPAIVVGGIYWFYAIIVKYPTLLHVRV